MDAQTIFDSAIAVGGVMVGWMLKIVWESIRKIELEVRNLEQQVHAEFVRREDFKSGMSELKADVREGFRDVKDMMAMLGEKIDKKEDRQ